MVLISSVVFINVHEGNRVNNHEVRTCCLSGTIFSLSDITRNLWGEERFLILSKKMQGDMHFNIASDGWKER